MSRFVLYTMRCCPFCVSFKGDFRSLVKDGEEIVLGDDDPRWRGLSIDYVPTVIEYEGEKELRRIKAYPMRGIPRKDFECWLADGR
jgi:hypothetical protein